MSDVDGAPAGPPSPKEDPETLVLRGRPRPVIRFRRGLIVGLTGAVSAALIALTWVSLEPTTFRLVSDQDLREIGAKPAAEAVAGAPATYGDLPRLGPPLPGDLGRAIVDRQRAFAEEDGGATFHANSEDARAEKAAVERQRVMSEEQAARSSAVLVQLGKSAAAPAVVPPSAGIGRATAPDTGSAAAGTGAGTLGQQRHKLDFVRSADGDSNHHFLKEPVSPWTLTAGTIIPASLLTGLNSDLPGMVVAQVTENVRDSATGRTVLIPQGTRLIGAYDSAVAFGQQRALLVWQRIVFPDGSSVRLDTMPAADAGGYSGLKDKVNFHEWRLLKGIILSSLLGVGTQFSAGGSGDLVRALRDSTWQNGSRAGEQIVSRTLDVQPTLTVRPGWPVRAIVHKDLVLKPWTG